MKECIVCKVELTGRQRRFCSEACKQRDKYERATGRRCKHCHGDIKKPVPVLGGWSQECSRKSCVKARSSDGD